MAERMAKRMAERMAEKTITPNRGTTEKRKKREGKRTKRWRTRNRADYG
jgi:hypothetical protein